MMYQPHEDFENQIESLIREDTDKLLTSNLIDENTKLLK